MNKASLVSKVSEKTGLPQSLTARIVQITIDVLSETLANEERVTLMGFGSFHVQARKSRVGRNPRTGETIKIEPRKVIRFKAGKELDEKLR